MKQKQRKQREEIWARGGGGLSLLRSDTICIYTLEGDTPAVIRLRPYACPANRFICTIFLDSIIYVLLYMIFGVLLGWTCRHGRGMGEWDELGRYH